MWRILIADDEPKIRRGLHSQIDQMNLDAMVCGEAEDGEDALEKAAALLPDILIVDINMPFLSGLDFIERLGAVRPGAKVIVVTGYEEFDYVRRAMALSVLDYLLKPVSEAELRKALAQAIDQLDREKEHNRHFEWALSQLQKRRDSLLEALLREAVSEDRPDEDMEEMLRCFGFGPLQRPRLVLAALDGEHNPLKRLMVQYALVDAVGPLLRRCRSACVFPDDRGNLLLFCDADPEMDSQLMAAVERALTSELGLSARLYAAPVARVSALGQAYDQLMERALKDKGVSPIVAAAQRYIEGKYMCPQLSLPDAARALGVNPSYLSRLMKQELGMSFLKYLTHVRIGHAARLMALGEMRVRQVADAVGYSGANYFSTAFKKVLGVSPAEYRREDAP